MIEPVAIYLDNCCLNRPFDDQDQDRVRLEAEAVTVIMRGVQAGNWIWVGSDVLRIENEENPDADRRRRVSGLLESEHRRALLDAEDIRRAAEIHAMGFDPLDAYHIAAAESGRCAVFLTTDDRLLSVAVRNRHRLRVSVRNPLEWLNEVIGP
jgi:predicted nucleic acid-binding protein